MHVLKKMFVSTSGQYMTRTPGLNKEVQDETEAALACIAHGDRKFGTYEEFTTILPNGATMSSGPINHSGHNYICGEVFNKAAAVQKLEAVIADMKSKFDTDPDYYKFRIPSMQDSLNRANTFSDDTAFIPSGTHDVMAIEKSSKVFDFKGKQIWPKPAA